MSNPTSAEVAEMMARTKALLEAKKRAMGLAPPEQSVSSGSTQVPLSSAAPPSATLTPEEQAMRKAELIKARLQGSTLLRNLPNTDRQGPPQQKVSGGLNVQQHPLLARATAKGASAANNRTSMPMFGFATVKANQRTAEREIKQVDKDQLLADTISNPYFDPTLANALPRERKRKEIQFARAGRYVEEGEAKRKEARLEELRAKIQAQSERAGVEAIGMDMATDNLIRPEEPPEIEWWDQQILHSAPSYEGWAEGTNDPFDGPDTLITSYIQRPVPIRLDSGVSVKPKALMLTQRERKKLRRQRRAELLKEKQEKIRLGLLPPEAPRVKLSNLMRVLGEQAVQDPTSVEARVRKDAKLRADAHIQQNEDRKLTPEQKREKQAAKLDQDSAMGTQSLVFKVGSLSHPKLKFKVEANATQLGLTGVVVQNPSFALVIVEGGPKAIKAYRKLMLRRIQWSVDGEDEVMDGTGTASTPNRCALAWEGQLSRRLFRHFRFHLCPTDTMARECLGKKAAHFWDLAKSASFDDLVVATPQ